MDCEKPAVCLAQAARRDDLDPEARVRQARWATARARRTPGRSRVLPALAPSRTAWSIASAPPRGSPHGTVTRTCIACLQPSCGSFSSLMRRARHSVAIVPVCTGPRPAGIGYPPGMRDTMLRVFGWRFLLVTGDPCVLDRWLWLRGRLRRGRMRTFDAGCGNGGFSIFAASTGNEVVAASFSPDEQQSARRRADALGVTGVDFRVIDLRELEDHRTALGMFDQIICLETIEHVSDDEGLVKSLAAMLKPGGQLLLSTPYDRHLPLHTEDPEPSAAGGRVTRSLRILAGAPRSDCRSCRPGGTGRGLRQRRDLAEADGPDEEADRTNRAFPGVDDRAAAAGVGDIRQAADRAAGLSRPQRRASRGQAPVPRRRIVSCSSPTTTTRPGRPHRRPAGAHFRAPASRPRPRLPARHARRRAHLRGDRRHVPAGSDLHFAL